MARRNKKKIRTRGNWYRWYQFGVLRLLVASCVVTGVALWAYAFARLAGFDVPPI